MYFHAVKSTAHPPFIGALGHSTDCIVKQSYTFASMQACCVLLEEKLHLQTIKHTDIRKFNVRPFGDPTRPFGDPTSGQQVVSKLSTSDQQVVSRWSLSGQQVVTK